MEPINNHWTDNIPIFKHNTENYLKILGPKLVTSQQIYFLIILLKKLTHIVTVLVKYFRSIVLVTELEQGK